MLTGNTHFLVVSWYFWATIVSMIVTSPRILNLFFDSIRSLSMQTSSIFSLVTLTIGLLISVAVGHFITSIFSFIFYLRGGYSQFEIHQSIKSRFFQLLQEKNDSDVHNDIAYIQSMSPSAFESFIIYHYSNPDFVSWIRRRYSVYYTGRK